jgi:hypothetical protein
MKERAELLDELRSAARYRGPEFSVCDKAADEIERLAKQVETLKAQQLEVRPPFYFGEGGKP